jgi:hypothetical protein
VLAFVAAQIGGALFGVLMAGVVYRPAVAPSA